MGKGEGWGREERYWVGAGGGEDRGCNKMYIWTPAETEEGL